MTQIAIKERDTFVGLKNFAKTFQITTITNTKILASAFSIDPTENIMVGTKGWPTASYQFIERVLLKCRGLLQELNRLCTQQNKQNALLKAENTSLKRRIHLSKKRLRC